MQKVLSLVAQGMGLESAFLQVRREVGLYDLEKSDHKTHSGVMYPDSSLKVVLVDFKQVTHRRRDR